MQCDKCGKANDSHFMFCLGCGHLLRQEPRAPAGEPGGAPMAMSPSTPRCSKCGGGRTLQGGIGPQLGVRVVVGGQYRDLPVTLAWVCVDCGNVALSLPEDARSYLAGATGR